MRTRFLALVFSLLVQNNVAPGTIAGRVFLPDGKPAVNARVAIQPETPPDGEKAGLSLTQTDDSGAYRLTEVRPGRYYIMIGPVARPVYFPGTVSRAEAKLISVTAGAEETVDFRNLLQGSLHVRGRFVPAPPPGAVLEMGIPSVPPQAVGETLVAADGSFVISGLYPGSYSLVVHHQPFERSQRLGRLLLETNLNDLLIVNGHVTIKEDNILLVTYSRMRELPASVAAAAAPVVEVSRTVPDRATPIALHVPVGTDGSFVLMLRAGDYTIRVGNLAAEYEVESIVSGSINLLAEPLKTAAPTLSEISISIRKAPSR